MVGAITRGRSRGRISSMTNQTSHYGIMGGIPRMIGHPAAILHKLQINTGTPIPPGAVEGLAFMSSRGLLSVNPQGSGGVGKFRGFRMGLVW